MTLSKKIFSRLFVLIIALSIMFSPLVSYVSYALELTGNSTFDAFINDSRWTNGVSWPDRSPKLSSWKSSGCCAYCADFVKFCFNIDSPSWGTPFYSVSEIQAGDVIKVGTDEAGHWFSVLKRSGNSLYVAEGNCDSKVRVGWNYSISGDWINGSNYSFSIGYHYGVPSGGNSISGTKVTTDDFYAYIIRPDVWKAIDASDSNNVQISTSSNTETNPSCIWRFEKQSNGAYVIYNQNNGYVLDAQKGGTDNGTNIIAYKDYKGDKNQQWFLYDTGSGIVIKSAKCDKVLDCDGDGSSAGTNIQLWEYNGSQAQIFNVYTIAKRWNPNSYDPYSYIVRQSPWLHIENSSSANVQIRESSNNGKDPKQVWWLNKLGDGSFYIANAYNDGKTNSYLTAASSTSNGSNVSVSALTESANQKWYIYKLQTDYGSGYILRTKDREKVLSCKDGSSAAGTNIIMNSFSLIQGQRFDIYSMSNDNRSYSRPGNPNVPTVTAPSKAVVGENITVSWTSSPLKNDFDTRSYRVEVLNSNNKVVKQITTTSLSTGYKFDTAGTYNIQVRAINNKYPGDSISSLSAKITITVSNPVRTISSSMLSSIPDQKWTGSALTPSVTVKDGSTTIKQGIDYTVAYTNNVNAGEAILTVTGKGNYNGSVSIKFKIVKEVHTITLNTVNNGTANLSKTSAYYGDEITVSTKPATGYVLDTIKVNGSAINGNTFKMPAKNTSVEVTFKQDINSGVQQITGETSTTPESPITTTTSVDTEFTFDGSKLKVTGDTTVEFVKASDDPIVKIPSTVELNGKTYIVNSIADKVFMNNKKLTQIIIGKNVTKIGDNVFYSCKKLKSVSGGENVKTIGVGAFMECTKLKSITIGSKVTSIGASAFQGDKSLKTVIVKSKKLKSKKVGANAFKGIAKKAVFKIPKSKAKKYQPMFKKVSKGTKITFKKS